MSKSQKNNIEESLAWIKKKYLIIFKSSKSRMIILKKKVDLKGKEKKRERKDKSKRQRERKKSQSKRHRKKVRKGKKEKYFQIKETIHNKVF